MTNPVVIHAAALPDKTAIYPIIAQAIQSGRITPEQADDLDEADIIIHDQDATRARRRANTLSSVTRTPVNAAVIGATALDECQEAAQQTGVTILLLPE